MFKSHTNRLFLSCPVIYRSRYDESNYPLMRDGIACGDGWFSLIGKLSRDVEAIATEMRAAGYHDDKLPIVIQVKQKFGGLRFYMANQTSEIIKLIGEAQKDSLLTCETCGQPGNLFNDRGWYRTVCETCMSNNK